MPEGESLSDETRELRRLARDLVALSTLPAIWADRDLAQVAESLAEVLLGTLGLDFVYLSVSGPGAGDVLEVARAAPRPDTDDLRQRLRRELAPWLDTPAPLSSTSIPHPLGSGAVRLAILPIGYEGEWGTLIAGSRRAAFPAEIDHLLLTVAANQAATVFQRRRAEEALEEANRRKDEFLAMLAHELRNPLASIRNATELLKQWGPPEPRLVRARAIIERQVQHQTRLLDDLLDVSRITRGKITLRPVRLDLVPLVRDTAEDCRSVLEAAGVTLELALPEAPVWVEGDPTRLAQVVSNLLNNTAKFTDPGGRVAVGCRVWGVGCREDGPDPTPYTLHPIPSAVLTIRDTGIGIEPEMLPHVFETFAQADRSLDRSRGGLGLGLALVKGLTELHGGRVRAESEGAGRGAAFIVSLPLARAPAASAAGAEPVVSTGPIRVLIVEDNRDAAESLRDLLEVSGCTVAVAFSGPEAIARARPFRPEVVLCDLGLPGMSGYEVAAALRHDASLDHTRLIAISGYGQEVDQQRSRDAGFDLHLTKPVGFEELQRLLEVTAEPLEEREAR